MKLRPGEVVRECPTCGKPFVTRKRNCGRLRMQNWVRHALACEKKRRPR